MMLSAAVSRPHVRPAAPCARARSSTTPVACARILSVSYCGLSTRSGASEVCTTGTGLFDVQNGSKWFMAQPKKRHSKRVRRTRRSIWLKKADKTAERAYSLGRSVLSGKNKSFLYNENAEDEDEDLDALDEEDDLDDEEEDAEEKPEK